MKPIVLPLIALMLACTNQNDETRSTASHFNTQDSDYQSTQNQSSPNETVPEADEPITGTPSSRWAGDEAIPPVQYYLGLFRDLKSRLDKSESLNLSEQEVANHTPILFIDFDSREMEYGFQRGESFIVCSDDPVLIPAAELSLDEQQAIIEIVQDYYTNAGVRVLVTDIEPDPSSDYTTVVVGGDLTSLGCEADDQVLGIAPVDRGNNNLNDIGFAFTKHLDPDADDFLYTIGVVVAHEAAHSYGLSHIDNNEAIMYSSVQPSVLGFGVGMTKKWQFFTVEQDGPAILRDVVASLDDEEDSSTNDPTSVTKDLCYQIDRVQTFLTANFPGIFAGSTFVVTPPLCL